MKPRPDHVVATEGGTMVCKNCGVEFVVKLPWDVDAYEKLARAFLSSHAKCKARKP